MFQAIENDNDVGTYGCRVISVVEWIAVAHEVITLDL